MNDYQEKTIKEIRTIYPEQFGKYTDSEIAKVYSQYCDLFYAAGWTTVEYTDFKEWALTAPIDR